MSPTARAFNFGMLGASLIGGTVSEAVQQGLGLKEANDDVKHKTGVSRYALNDRNAD